ncbi:MAG TPA: UDP-N-acetylmuramate dehydrogenase [Patescibacteria group bacterium]|nr:UDP-N-acetylmuramate dehydrogenase [Patescibacteria group bacterium]
MQIQQNAPLSQHSTMRLGGTAANLTEVTDRAQVAEAVSWADQHKLPIIMIGQGSNIVWTDQGFPGLVIVNKIKHYEVYNEDDENVYITIGAGEIWDSVVERAVASGLTGIEALSLIPGTTGATPVQNVGAYGQEISNTLVSVEAYDRQAKQLATIASADCKFGYRTSRFKTVDKEQFLITTITLHLRRGNPLPPFYDSVQTYFDSHQISQPTPAQLREAVIAIRTAKLPDPAQVANNGSFFTNPIISKAEFEQLRAKHRELGYHDTSDGRIKLSAAELIELAGFKNMHDSETGMATWPQQALVLINEHAHSTADLLKFKQKIVDRVQAMFGIALQQEPELIGKM